MNLYAINTGNFKLDGGAMFGVVPKSIWSKTNPASYNDFWSQNIDVKGLEVKKGKFKGENYNYVVLKKTLLYPQKT